MIPISETELHQVIQYAVDMSFGLGVIVGVLVGCHLPSFAWWLRYPVWIRIRRLLRARRNRSMRLS